MTCKEIIENAKKCCEPFEVRDIVKQQQETINQQKAEIERLKKGWKADVIETENIKTEAIKEFISSATDLCYKEFENNLEVAHTFATILTEAQKEMVGDDK